MDLKGSRYGRLIVIERVDDRISPSGCHYDMWKCKCDCGNFKTVSGANLKYGITKSCGCLQKETVSSMMKKYNTYDLESKDYGIGYTTKGEPFWFDKEDYDKIKDICWYYSTEGYLLNKSNEVLYFHRYVMGVTDPNIKVDHKIHPPKPEHKVDNRKQNLRIVTNSQNNMNSHINSNNTSGVTGISLFKLTNQWEAYITVEQNRIRLGLFDYDKFDDAVEARKKAEEQYFGDFSLDNSNTNQLYLN